MIALRDLQLFLHLSDSLHFGKTSEAMHVSSSTLSRVIQRLEQQAEISLFDRDNRSVKLTPQGELFRKFADSTLKNWQHFKQETQRNDDELKGKLSVFCSVTASYSHLPPMLNRLAELYPMIDIQLATGDVAEGMQRVTNGEVDIAITAKPDKLPNNIAFSSFDSLPISLIGPNTSNTLSAKLRQPEIDWAQIPFIVAHSGLTRTRSETWFKQMAIKPNIYATVAGHEAIVSMVALGLGVGIAPNVVLANSPVRKYVQVIKSPHEIVPFELGVCCLSKRLTDPLVNAFWQLTKE